MNLIEQLGGYGWAKEFVNHVRENDDLYKVLAKYLLQYRRQHNIFEIRDMVVSKNGCELLSEITYLQGGLAKIKNKKFDHVYSLQDFRHATDEEIKAKMRLEVGNAQ